MSDYYKNEKILTPDGMAFLRMRFPDAVADSLNFVLFSTSGVHGSYLTIEDAEAEGGTVTFLLIQPRTVNCYYGNCQPESPDDFRFLKVLRASSHAVCCGIGSSERE